MRMRHRCECLSCEVKGPNRGNSPLYSVRQRLFAKLHRNNELIVDIARIHHRKDIRVLEFARNLHLVQKLIVPGCVVRLGNLQRDL